jgi:hypothetical protein
MIANDCRPATNDDYGGRDSDSDNRRYSYKVR